ncbi:MAG: hypothetical protein JXQ82_09150 [Methanomicrobiaceae archaeon]|nr:hypothetical protein [Methanomicrobiaceae archaeon]
MNLQKNKKVLAICESKKQVEFLFAQSHLYPNIDHWIAASSSAAYSMSKLGISFNFIEDYQSDINANYVESLQSEQICWAKKVDSFIQERIPECAQIEFQPARFALYFIKNSWDTHIHRADLLEQIKKNIQFDEIIYFRNEHPLTYTSNLSPVGSALSECIPLWAEHYGIKTIPMAALPQDLFWETQVYMKNNPLRIIKKIPEYIVSSLDSFKYILDYRSFIHLSKFSLKSSSTGKKIILIRKKYDLNHEIINILKSNDIKCSPFDAAISLSYKYYNQSPEITDKLADEWNAIKEYDWFWQPEGWQNWSIKKVLEPLFNKFWFGIIPVLWNGMNASMKILQSINPQAICVSLIYSNDHAELGFIMAAQNNNIPVIMYQHGACMGDIENNVWDLTEGQYCNYSLVYGIGEKQYLESRSLINKLKNIPIAVGSTRLDRISHGINNNKILKIRKKIVGKSNIPIVLYVPGMNLVNFYRYDCVNENNNDIFNARENIAKFFSGQNGIKFVYKVFLSLGEDPTQDMLGSICPGCTVIDDIPLTELLWAADLIIYEVPSTGMYEGLVSNKPIIAYVDRDVYSMTDSTKKMLRKRAIVSETHTEFISDIKKFIHNGDFSPIIEPDNEFLSAFCTHLNDGNSAKRAAGAILSIVNSNEG